MQIILFAKGGGLRLPTPLFQGHPTAQIKSLQMLQFAMSATTTSIGKLLNIQSCHVEIHSICKILKAPHASSSSKELPML